MSAPAADALRAYIVGLDVGDARDLEELARELRLSPDTVVTNWIRRALAETRRIGLTATVRAVRAAFAQDPPTKGATDG